MLYKRGKTWWLDFTAPNGERVRRSTGTTDKAAAQELHDRLKADLWRTTRLGEAPTYTWDEAAVRWLDEHQHKRSLNDDMQKLSWLQSHLRGVTLDSITADQIREMLAAKKREASASTANHYLALIRAILNAAADWGWIPATPRVKPYPVQNKRLRWLTQEEAARLLEELPEHLRVMAHFSLLTGLRQSNVVELEWHQVDMRRRVVWIHPDQAKAGKGIAVPLSEEAIQVLRGQIGKHHTRVFTYKERPVASVRTKAWEKALARASIKDFTWHGLRHTWASWHVQAGTPLAVLKELGGWASLEMVQRYAHLSPDHTAQYAANVGVHGTKMAQSPLRTAPQRA